MTAAAFPGEQVAGTESHSRSGPDSLQERDSGQSELADQEVGSYGVGEHIHEVREQVLQGFEWPGPSLHAARNSAARGGCRADFGDEFHHMG